VRLPGRGDTLALLPYADLLNHQPGAEAFLDYEGEGDAGAVVLRVDRAYGAGEQVFISYGEKSSGELLLQYGFVPPAAAASNPHESVPLTLTLSGDDPLYDVKTAALQQWQVTQPQLTFPVRMAGMPAALLPTAAFVALGDDCTAEQVHAVAAVAFGGARGWALSPSTRPCCACVCVCVHGCELVGALGCEMGATPMQLSV
jgi:hypothetical protein